MSAAFTRGWRKAARTLLQLVASGGLTALVNQFGDGLSTNQKGLVAVAWMLVVTFAQNYAETVGAIPALLPTPGLVPTAGPVVAMNVGTVETEVDTVGAAVGEVSGTVTDTAGELMGEVTGLEDPDI